MPRTQGSSRPSHTHLRQFRTCLVGAALAVHLLKVGGADHPTLGSPNGMIRVDVRMPQPGTAERPTWEASLRGKPLLSNCRLGLETVDGGELLAGVWILDERSRAVDETVLVRFGNASQARDRFTERRWNLETRKRTHVEVVSC